MSLDTVVVALVFAAQIGVLSFFTPHTRRRNFAFMLGRYPPAEYPRLYPVPADRTAWNLTIFKPVHAAIGVGATVVLVAGLASGQSAFDLGRWMFVCLLAQILPLYLNLPFAIKLARAFRALPPPSVRSAELKSWRVLDFVSPVWVGLGVAGAAFALASAVVAYLQTPSTLRIPTIAALIGGVLLLLMGLLLSGSVTFARADPYMTQHDTFRARQRRLILVFRVGAVFGAYAGAMALWSARLLHFDIVYVYPAVSVMFQLLGLALVRSQRRDLETRDFSVYRLEGGVAS